MTLEQCVGCANQTFPYYDYRGQQYNSKWCKCGFNQTCWKTTKELFFLKKKEEVSQGQEHCPIFNNSSYGNDMLVASGNFSTVYCILNQLRSLIYTENSEGVNNSFLYVVSLSVELQGIYVAMYPSLFLISHKWADCKVALKMGPSPSLS